MSNTPARPEQARPEGEREKLPYTPPVLTVYGDLTHLTRAKGQTGQRTDGALANNNKTR